MLLPFDLKLELFLVATEKPAAVSKAINRSEVHTIVRILNA